MGARFFAPREAYKETDATFCKLSLAIVFSLVCAVAIMIHNNNTMHSALRYKTSQLTNSLAISLMTSPLPLFCGLDAGSPWTFLSCTLPLLILAIMSNMGSAFSGFFSSAETFFNLQVE